jgi:hypothetical protein
MASATDERDVRLNRVMALHSKNAAETLEMGVGELGNPPLTPMLAEIKAVLDSARVAEAEIRRKHDDEAALPGSTLAMTLAAHKKAVHLQVLRIQARHARLEGRAELEQRILTSIAEIERPLAPTAPKMKPVSAPTAGTTNPR